jgi:hypothetical protein
VKLYAGINLPSFVTLAKANEIPAARMLYGSCRHHGPRQGDHAAAKENTELAAIHDR